MEFRMGFGFKIAMPRGLRRRHPNQRKRRLSLSIEIIAGGYLHPQDDDVFAAGLATGLADRATSCRSEIGTLIGLQHRSGELNGFCSSQSLQPREKRNKKAGWRTIRLKNAAEY